MGGLTTRAEAPAVGLCRTRCVTARVATAQLAVATHAARKPTKKIYYVVLHVLKPKDAILTNHFHFFIAGKFFYKSS